MPRREKMLPRMRHLAKRGLIQPRANFDTFSSSFYSVFQVQQLVTASEPARSSESCILMPGIACSESDIVTVPPTHNLLPTCYVPPLMHRNVNRLAPPNVLYSVQCIPLIFPRRLLDFNPKSKFHRFLPCLCLFKLIDCLQSLLLSRPL